MKKQYLLVCLITSLLLSNCSTFYSRLTKDQLHYSVVKKHQLSKDEVYSLAIEWIFTTVSSGEEVIKHKDKSEGKIIARGTGWYYGDWLHSEIFGYPYVLTIKIDKGKYEMIFDCPVEVGLESLTPTSNFDSDIQEIYDKLINSFGDYLEKNK